jgi:glycosyltransferase involved in cell wall biosynthesis
MSIIVSVIIPAYNAEKYLSETLESVLNQTFSDFELLIIDDGSTDRTAEIVSDYSRQDKRLKLVSQQNQGVSIARNRGIQLAQGEYLAFLDADDRWLPNKLAAHVEHFNNNLRLGISFGRVEFISFEGGSTNYLSNSRLDKINPEHLYYENLVVTPSNAVIRRSVFENTDGFDPNLYGTEDMELFFRIIYQGWKVEGIDDVLVNYRTNQAGVSSNLYRMEENWEKLNLKIQTYAPEFIKRHRQQADAFFLRYLARRTIRNRDSPKIGVDFITRALKSDWKIIFKEPRRTILTAFAVYFRYSIANFNFIK